MKSIVFFNNKGGVGKTTLTCNVVSYLNAHFNKRVLLVDADPQCNATQALLTESQCEEIYTSSKPHLTLFDYLSPLEAGEPSIAQTVRPLLGTHNRFSTDLIPGHPKVALVEDRLSQSWGEAMRGSPAGYRVTNWCSQLFEKLHGKYDLIIFDVGPSLGALNRTVILSCDYMVTPFGCDIFSLLGIQNIATWIRAWQKQYDRAITNIKEDRPEVLGDYPIVTETNAKFMFAGYSVQQYVTRSFATGKRPVKAYEKIMKMIPRSVEDNMSQFMPGELPKDQTELGHIPFLYSLVPLAQDERRPIHALRESGRLTGAQYQQVAEYNDVIHSVCAQLLRNIGEA